MRNNNIIKSRVRNYIIIPFLFSFCFTIAQNNDYRSDVLTPKGSNVVAYIRQESSVYIRTYLDASYSASYPNAIQLKTYDNFSSSRKFNCHGYAWHMSELEKSLNEPRWIGYFSGNTDEHIYWEDGSYIETSEEKYPGKVSWSSGDHSAITTQQKGWYISKWNEFPLMKHKWNDSPYGTLDLKYYRFNISEFSIEGSYSICKKTTYTINTHSDVDITWQVSSNLQILSSTNKSVTVKGVASGIGYIKAIKGNFELEKEVSIEMVSSVFFTVLGVGSPYGQLDAIVTGGNPPYSWYKNDNLIQTSHQQQVTLPFGCDGGVLKVSYSHSCGIETYSEPVASCNNYFSIYPNPASGSVTIQLTESNLKTTSKTTQKMSYEVYLYNLQGHKLRSVTGRENKVQIPLHSLSGGLYIVQVVKDGKTYQRKLLVE